MPDNQNTTLPIGSPSSELSDSTDSPPELEVPQKLPFHQRLKQRTISYFSWQRFKQRLSELNVSQKFYIVAMVFFLLEAGGDDMTEEAVITIGVIAGIGLVRELWQVFHRLWDVTLGKGIILVLYAGTANIALAVSALKINAITGVEPTPFVFTLGFTTLMLLPFWITLATVMFFSVAVVALNIWLFLGILLRLLRVKVQMHWEDKSFAIITMIFRLVLIPHVIMAFMYMLTPYAKQIALFNEQVEIIEKNTRTSSTGIEVKFDEPDSSAEQLDAEVKADTNTDTQSPVEETLEPKITVLDRIIAGFIYQFETYPYSACKKSSAQRTLWLDEESVFVAEKDDSALGYRFSMLPCEYDYENSPEGGN